MKVILYIAMMMSTLMSSALFADDRGDAIIREGVAILKDKLGLDRHEHLQHISPQMWGDIFQLYYEGEKLLDRERENQAAIFIKERHEEFPDSDIPDEILEYAVSVRVKDAVKNNLVKHEIPGKGIVEINFYENHQTPEDPYYWIRVTPTSDPEIRDTFKFLEDRVNEPWQEARYNAIKNTRSRRNVTTIKTNAEGPYAIEDFSPAVKAGLNLYHIEQYATAIAEMPTLADQPVSAICSVVEMGGMACFDGVMWLAFDDYEWKLGGYWNKLGSDFVKNGLGSRTNQNWQEQESDFDSDKVKGTKGWLKRYAWGLISGVTLKAAVATGGFWAGMAKFNPLTAAGWLEIAFVMLNNAMYNVVKDEGHQLLKAADKAGMVEGDLYFQIPFKKKKVAFRDIKKTLATLGFGAIYGLPKYIDVRVGESLANIFPDLPEWANMMITRPAVIGAAVVPLIINVSIARRALAQAKLRHEKFKSNSTKVSVEKIQKEVERLERRKTGFFTFLGKTLKASAYPMSYAWKQVATLLKNKGEAVDKQALPTATPTPSLPPSCGSTFAPVTTPQAS